MLQEKTKEIETIEQLQNADFLAIFFFCNSLKCEEKLKKELPNLSIRCLKKNKKEGHCKLCKQTTKTKAYLARAF